MDELKMQEEQQPAGDAPAEGGAAPAEGDKPAEGGDAPATDQPAA